MYETEFFHFEIKLLQCKIILFHTHFIHLEYELVVICSLVI